MNLSTVKIVRDCFGTAINPITNVMERIFRWTFTNRNNMSMQIINYGATLVSIKVPDRCGNCADVCLGFDDMNGYQTPNNPYIGSTIGRVASRVSNAQFTMAGKTYNVSKNFLNKHALHGGLLGFDKVHWEFDDESIDTVVLKHCSPAGSQGYPGDILAKAHYTLTNDNTIQIAYEAETNELTPINMTNHAYFNLAGHDQGKKALYDHMVMIKADQYTEKDAETVPTGRFFSVKNTPHDLNKETNVGKGLKWLESLNNIGYDDNYCLKHKPNELVLQAKMYHPPSGRLMVIHSNQPAMHFYTSNVMPDPEKDETPLFGKDKALYTKQGSFCMEPHQYPDAVNRPEFPPIFVNPGEKYLNIMRFSFLVVEP